MIFYCHQLVNWLPCLRSLIFHLVSMIAFNLFIVILISSTLCQEILFEVSTCREHEVHRHCHINRSLTLSPCYKSGRRVSIIDGNSHSIVLLQVSHNSNIKDVLKQLMLLESPKYFKCLSEIVCQNYCIQLYTKAYISFSGFWLT